MKNINLILTVVNILILAINSSLSFFKYLTDRKLLYNERIWDPLEKKLFKPYLHKIEIFLFQKWEGDNQKKIYNGIATLKKLLDSEESDLRMYLPPRLIYYTKYCYTLMTAYYEEDNKNKKQKLRKKIQRKYIIFSKEYLKLLNRYRNYSFLSKYRADSRYYLKLHHSILEQIKLSFLMNLMTPSGIFLILMYVLGFILFGLAYIKNKYGF